MMFHRADQHFIARLHILPSVGPCNEIDTFRGSPHKDDFTDIRCVNEPSNLFACVLVGLRRYLAEIVESAVDIRVLHPVVTVKSIEDGKGLLAGRGIIEVDQRLAPNPAVKKGKIGSKTMDITWSLRDHGADEMFAPAHLVISSLIKLSVHQRFQLVFQSLDVNALDDIAGERKRKDIPRHHLADTTRAQIENLLVVQLSNGSTMRALDIVGEDLQLRLRIDRRIISQEQSLVCLLGVRFLGVFSDKNLAVENSLRLSVEDRLVQLMACTMRPGMVDQRVVIDQLGSGGHR